MLIITYLHCFPLPTSGATRTKDARELLYARQKVVVTSKAFGLQAIDLVYIDYKDVEGLRQQAREGALMGFTGKVSVYASDNRHKYLPKALSGKTLASRWSCAVQYILHFYGTELKRKLLSKSHFLLSEIT